jgi:hypothetical protein
MGQYLWYRVLKLRLLSEPHLLARDLLIAAATRATRPRKRF